MPAAYGGGHIRAFYIKYKFKELTQIINKLYSAMRF